MKPHRGTLILVLGILSIVISCFPLGIVSWIMGNADLKEMDSGAMDSSGRSLTNVGRILGMVSVGLFIFGLIVAILMLSIGGGIAAASAQ